MTLRFVLCGIFSTLFACLIAPIVLQFCKKLKASQSILHYVDKHAQKQGTPTMGGVIFLLTLIFATLFMTKTDVFVGWFAILVTLGYGVIGFLDDFIKVHYHQNEGLKPYQKIIGQVGVAIAVALFLYFSGKTQIVFFKWSFDLGFWVIPLAILVMVATTNSVNLTDGLDGLAGGTSFVYVLFFGIILTTLQTSEMDNMAVLCFGLCGGLLGFLTKNCFPAQIFMGDTGSLALGGFIGVTALLSGLTFYLPIMGVMFVLSTVSDIIQVLHFKRTHKRVFLMAPLHHHFEQKGVHENRIVFVYILVTMLCCLAVLSGALIVAK